MENFTYIDFTYRCNQSCLFCISSHANKEYSQNYSATNYFKLPTEKTDSSLFISGGEPTIEKSLIDFCQQANYFFKSIFLSTNGRKFSDQNYAKELLHTRISSIIIPFLSSEKQIHDYLVSSNGAFDQLITGLQNLLSFRDKSITRIILKVLITRPGIQCLDSLVEFWQNLEIVPDEVQISGLHIGKHVLRNSDIIPSVDETATHVSNFVRGLTKANITFSAFDFPWCILENDAVKLIIQSGELYPFKPIIYSKHYYGGVRYGSLESYHFSSCHCCELNSICNGFFPLNIELIEKEYSKRIRPVKFI